MIKKVLSIFLKSIASLFVKVWYANYLSVTTDPLPTRVLFKAGFQQRLLRRNSNVKWPVHKSTTVKSPDKINPGTRCPGLSKGCHIDGRNGIIFGKNVRVGPNVSIISQNHDVCDFDKYVENSAIIIGDNCWIGANAIILPGVTLASHTIVAAGSVVSKSFNEKNIVIAGVPATKIKTIGDYKN